MTASKHFPVLLQESVSALLTDRDGFYIDGTFGRGGHCLALLSKLAENGEVLAFDKDPQAVACARGLSRSDPRLRVHHGSFADIRAVLEAMERPVGSVNGVLLDLGVSSPQLDDPQRGFSFQNDGPLDMRMDSSSGLSAEQWLASVSEKQLAQVLWEYGEERFSRRIARAIVEEREREPITRTQRLADIVKQANPRWERDKHPATRSFQAIRIAVNGELDDLKRTLDSIIEVLAPGGRLVVISFHSLEDRLVKRFMREAQRGPVLPREVALASPPWQPRLKKVGKAVRAGGEEVEQNVRSRSAVMRVAERTLTP